MMNSRVIESNLPAVVPQLLPPGSRTKKSIDQDCLSIDECLERVSAMELRAKMSSGTGGCGKKKKKKRRCTVGTTPVGKAGTGTANCGCNREHRSSGHDKTTTITTSNAGGEQMMMPELTRSNSSFSIRKVRYHIKLVTKKYPVEDDIRDLPQVRDRTFHCSTYRRATGNRKTHHQLAVIARDNNNNDGGGKSSATTKTGLFLFPLTSDSLDFCRCIWRCMIPAQQHQSSSSGSSERGDDHDGGDGGMGCCYPSRARPGSITIDRSLSEHYFVVEAVMRKVGIRVNLEGEEKQQQNNTCNKQEENFLPPDHDAAQGGKRVIDSHDNHAEWSHYRQ